ncbi:hypothetical protein B0H17DRAFT_1130024 [Mycena rosella]|uniref:Uncharacterized protein n=1 Tax=Mycena rosella TaxID=1033263 RepID=A0AAD7DSN2_MYCRO|nr:hypothetical protein B0H17DRAFT_1130024 [Mycena rosella]
MPSLRCVVARRLASDLAEVVAATGWLSGMGLTGGCGIGESWGIPDWDKPSVKEPGYAETGHYKRPKEEIGAYFDRKCQTEWRHLQPPDLKTDGKIKFVYGQPNTKGRSLTKHYAVVLVHLYLSSEGAQSWFPGELGGRHAPRRMDEVLNDGIRNDVFATIGPGQLQKFVKRSNFLEGVFKPSSLDGHATSDSAGSKRQKRQKGIPNFKMSTQAAEEKANAGMKQVTGTMLAKKAYCCQWDPTPKTKHQKIVESCTPTPTTDDGMDSPSPSHDARSMEHSEVIAWDVLTVMYKKSGQHALVSMSLTAIDQLESFAGEYADEQDLIELRAAEENAHRAAEVEALAKEVERRHRDLMAAHVQSGPSTEILYEEWGSIGIASWLACPDHLIIPPNPSR